MSPVDQSLYLLQLSHQKNSNEQIARNPQIYPIIRDNVITFESNPAAIYANPTRNEQSRIAAWVNHIIDQPNEQ